MVKRAGSHPPVAQIQNKKIKTTMTNKYFLFPALALALAACSQSDEPGAFSEPKAASFSAQIGQPVSRAAGTEWAAGDAIGISGVSGTKT